MTEKVDDRILTSLAILQVNWDSTNSSYLSNFVRFVIEALRREKLPSASAEEVQAGVARHFGLKLPLSVVKTIVKLAIRAHLGSRQVTGDFILSDAAKSSDASLAAEQQVYLRQQRSLVAELVKHVAEKFSQSWTPEQALTAVFDYVDRHASKLLSAAVRGDQNPVWDAPTPTAQDALVASFVKTIHDTQAEMFEYFVQVVKGSMLVSSVYLPSATSPTQHFSKTDLILDTPVLLSALGYDGRSAESAALEMLALARDQGAGIATFAHVARETKGVLEAAARRISNPGSREPLRSVEVSFIERGCTSSDVLLEIEQLDSRLEGLGIRVLATPDRRNHWLSVSEPDLHEQLAEKVAYSRPGSSGLQRDLDSLTGVYRMRNGREGDRLETARAVLVTHNSSLVRVAKEFEDFRRQGWPVAMLTDQVTSIIWMKQPLAAPDLPRNQVLADCLAVLSPKPALWNLYMDKADQLLARGEITEEQVLLLRSSLESRMILQEATNGDPDEVTADSVKEILSRVESGIRGPVEEKVSALEMLRVADDALAREREAELSELRERADLLIGSRDALVARIRSISNFFGSAVRWVVVAAIAALSVAAVLLPPDPTAHPFSWPRIVLTLGAIVLAILAVSGGVSPIGAGVKTGASSLVFRLITKALKVS